MKKNNQIVFLTMIAPGYFVVHSVKESSIPVKHSGYVYFPPEAMGPSYLLHCLGSEPPFFSAPPMAMERDSQQHHHALPEPEQ